MAADETNAQRTQLAAKDRGDEWLVDGIPPREVEEGDADALRELSDAKAEFDALGSKMAGDLYEQGRVLMRIRAQRLYRALGYRQFGHYTDEVLGMDGRSAEYLTECARAFTKDQFVQLGPTLARLGLQLLNATPEDDGPEDLFDMMLRHGSGAGTPFLQATTRQVSESIKGERGLLAAGPLIVPPGIEDTAKNLQAAAGAGARIKLKNFKSKEATTTGLVIELPNASPEAMEQTLGRIMDALPRKP
ncbi:MAG: hypothetical protein ACK4N5_26630 [Myxococcales bacterium]